MLCVWLGRVYLRLVGLPCKYILSHLSMAAARTNLETLSDHTSHKVPGANRDNDGQSSFLRQVSNCILDISDAALVLQARTGPLCYL